MKKSWVVTGVESTDGTTCTATAAVATVTDVFTTLLTPNEALLGTYKLVQTAMVVGAGFVGASKLYTGNFFNFGR